MKIVFCFILILAFLEYLNGDYNFEKLESGGMLTLGYEKVWSLWKSKFSKMYLTQEEDTYRRAIWENNLRIMQAHNLLYDLGQETYSMGINAFSDLTFTEFSQMYLMNNLEDQLKNGLDNVTYYESPSDSDKLPSSVDWRKQGYVTNVKNQGKCGSCWAFSATGSLEGQQYRKTKKLVSLSEQQLVDCDKMDHGCQGGLVPYAYYYIIKAKGIMSEKSYPYIGKASSTCKYKRSKAVAYVKGFRQVFKKESELARAVTQVGPISVAIFVNSNFQHYKSGIYIDKTCKGRLNHGVLTVGYGSASSNYWIVKNSWGPSWGQQGYVNMAKNRNNQCGIANYAFFPVV